MAELTSDDVIEVGTFLVRRYRLTCDTSSVTVLDQASTDISWVGDRFRVLFTHGGHEMTTEWLENRKPGEWITVEGWAPPPMPPIPTDGLWQSVKIRGRLSHYSPDGFVFYREHSGPSYLVALGVPPLSVAS